MISYATKEVEELSKWVKQNFVTLKKTFTGLMIFLFLTCQWWFPEGYDFISHFILLYSFFEDILQGEEEIFKLIGELFHIQSTYLEFF